MAGDCGGLASNRVREDIGDCLATDYTD